MDNPVAGEKVIRTPGGDLRIAAYLFLWGASAVTGVMLLVGRLIFVF